MKRGGWLLGAALALPPLLALGVRLLLHEGRDANDDPAGAPSAGAAEARPAFAGEAAIAAGATLRVRLAALHADPVQQAFDRDALAQRFALPDGEPFLVQLELRGAPPEGAGDSRTVELDLAGLEVLDGAGRALAVAVPAARAAARAPLSTLFLPPRALRAGEVVEAVLWGREPGAGARFVLPGRAEVPLATELRGDDPDLPWARIDARPARSPEEPR